MSSHEQAANEDDDEQYRDRQQKWEGFHFTRLTCISILTLLIMILALALDSLSVWGKRRVCTKDECQSSRDPTCQGTCGAFITADGDYEFHPSCEGNGECGWRTGRTKWIQPDPSSPGCPPCADYPGGLTCTSFSTSTPSPSSTPTPQTSVTNWESEFNYVDLCDEDSDAFEGACMAKDGGNVYLAFTIFAIIFNCFILCIIAPLYCRDSSIFPCAVCDEKTHIFLGALYALTFFCNFIPVVVWLGAADGGMCDNADPLHDMAFVSDTTNFPGYSLGGLMLCIIANMVGCIAVCCCWGDNRHYGDERDQAKIDRDREKAAYKEQEMQQTQSMNQGANGGQGQGDNTTYSYN